MACLRLSAAHLLCPGTGEASQLHQRDATRARLTFRERRGTDDCASRHGPPIGAMPAMSMDDLDVLSLDPRIRDYVLIPISVVVIMQVGARAGRCGGTGSR